MILHEGSSVSYLYIYIYACTAGLKSLPKITLNLLGIMIGRGHLFAWHDHAQPVGGGGRTNWTPDEKGRHNIRGLKWARKFSSEDMKHEISAR